MVYHYDSILLIDIIMFNRRTEVIKNNCVKYIIDLTVTYSIDSSGVDCNITHRTVVYGSFQSS